MDVRIDLLFKGSKWLLKPFRQKEIVSCSMRKSRSGQFAEIEEVPDFRMKSLQHDGVFVEKMVLQYLM